MLFAQQRSPREQAMQRPARAHALSAAVQIVTVDEAKTFYPLFGLGANVALIFSGRAVKYFSQVLALLLLGAEILADLLLGHRLAESTPPGLQVTTRCAALACRDAGLLGQCASAHVV